MKKRIVVVLTLLTLLTGLLLVSANEPEALSQKSASQEEANRQYNQIYQQLPDRSISYPPYYAGAYIDENNQLVVLVTEEGLAEKETLKKITGNDDLQIRLAAYSYGYLQSLMDDIQAHMPEHVIDDGQSLLITSAYIKDDQNCIMVSLNNLTDENISKFKQDVSNSPAIRFEEGGCFEFTSAV
ncbi:hypothetical protein [Candidatus Soleaferrea massiliensis]|uniref:hypothetical protein n=1 Tax=Candidatus Soleaferrea massiliensis TaxID=1470354 RepID=UPI00058F6634|nr:hypothetical protein [Candidatus Soleaferrea massiliensis]